MINRLLRQTIVQIGLSDKHAYVYEALLMRPMATPLQLARETKLNRSSLYRYLEELRDCGLVELLLGDKSSRYEAIPSGLKQYLTREEARVDELRTTIPKLADELSRVSEKGRESEIKYFQGKERLKQMLWNVVASGQDYAGLGYEDWNTSVGKNFAEKLREKNMKSGVKSREITNDPSADYGYTGLGKNYLRVYEHRRIDSKILEIKHDTYIYGDVFAYYYHYQGEYFGVEIHNKEIARTERQIFEILWGMAK